MQRIRPASAKLREEIGVEHALASRRPYNDGSEVLYDFAASTDDPAAAQGARDPVVVGDGQRVFTEVVEQYVRRIEHAEDGYARLVHLPGYEVADVIVDPRVAFAQPAFQSTGVRVADVVGRLRAGEPLDSVADDYGLEFTELEEAWDAASRRAA